MGASREELLKKLEAISILHKKALNIKRKMNAFTPEDNYERKVKVPKFPLEIKSEYDEEVCEILVDDVDHTESDAVEAMANCYDVSYKPKEPAEPKIKKFSYSEDGEYSNKKSKLGCLSYLAAGVTIFFALSLILGTAEGAESTITLIAIIAAVLFVLFRIMIVATAKGAKNAEAKARAKYNAEKEQIMADYNAKVKDFEAKCEAYGQTKAEFLKKYAAWREIYLESVAEEDEIEAKLEADRQAEVAKIEREEFDPVFNDLAAINDIVTTEYLPALDTLIELIRSGRADDLKEAINLYEDIRYRERQLQLEREKEAQRREEAALKREAEERHYREQMEFQKQQEYNRQREAAEQRQAEERRHREDMQQREREARDRQLQERERARKEEYNARMNRIDEERKLSAAAQAQCRACANAGRCNMMVHNKTPNCTGFRPR